MAQRLGMLTLGDLFHDDPPRNDGEVRRQGTLAAKRPERRVFVRQQRDKNFGRQILNIIRRQRHAAGMGRVVDDMHEQPNKPIDEIFPRSGFFGEAAFQQSSVDFRECHDATTVVKSGAKSSHVHVLHSSLIPGTGQDGIFQRLH